MVQCHQQIAAKSIVSFVRHTEVSEVCNEEHKRSALDKSLGHGSSYGQSITSRRSSTELVNDRKTLDVDVPAAKSILVSFLTHCNSKAMFPTAE